MAAEIMLILILVVLLWITTKKPSTMPPGSFGLPIIGTLPTGKISIAEHLQHLQKKYGNIFTTKWGVHRIVVLSDFNLIKKAFQHPDLQGRPRFPSFKMLHQGKDVGVIFNDGQVSSDNRRFLLHHLRDLGLGRTVLESSIQDEAALLVDYLEKTCVDKPAVMDLAINCAVVNVLWQMVANTRYDVDDPESTYYNEQSEGILEVFQTKMFLLDIFPMLYEILPKVVLNLLFGLEKGFKHAAELNKMSRRVVQTHMKTLDPHNPRDLIDQFLLQYGDSCSGYSLTDADEENLISLITDMFQAGSESTSTTIRWMILYLAVNPDIQAKVHKCLDAVVPSGRLPGLGDRSQLPYVDAVLLETLRLSSLTPTGVMHRATADVPFEGYVIPKDTLIVGCTKFCHGISSAWKTPSKFNPAHFLDENGELAGKKENFLPFSVGRRYCLGESLARMQLYLFGAAILQRFKIEPPAGVKLSLEVDPSQVLVNKPLPFKVVLKKRS